MPIWSNAYLAQIISDGEEDISKKVHCLFNRSALTIVDNTATYALPPLFLSVILVSWKGRLLEPLTQKELMRYDSNYLTNKNTPFWYSIDSDGPGTIRFYPVPNENITAVTTNLFGSEIPNQVIISYFQAADTASANVTTPKWISRRLIKDYCLWRAFQQEGKGQNLKAASYFLNKFIVGVSQFKLLNKELTAIIQRLSHDILRPRFARPLLPISFGSHRNPLP